MDQLKVINVLNIAQPNAHNIMFNGKNVENRSSNSRIRGTIAIYASKTYAKSRFENQQLGNVKKEECTFGCIIGFADLVDCITEDQVSAGTKKWFHGPYGYILANIIVLPKPIEVTPPQGAVIWWPLSGKNLQSCLKQVSQAKFTPMITLPPDKDKKSPPRLSARARLTPSSDLAAVIGAKPLSYKKSIQALFDYLVENRLVEEGETVDKFETDAKLRKIFSNRKIVQFSEVKDIMLKNLT